MPEHGADGEKPAHGFTGMHTVFDIGAHDACRGFRAQGHGTPLAVGNAVHFLLHHVGFGADAAAEKIGVLHEGSTKLTKAVAGENLERGGLHHLKKTALRRKLVGKALDSLNLCHERTPAK